MTSGKLLLLLLAGVSCPLLPGQENALPGAPAANSSTPAQSVLEFNGTPWRPAENAQFQARFEKFLNTPEESDEAEKNHRKILNQIAQLLEPRSLTPDSLSNAFRLLTRATYYPGDSRLSDTLANGIYAIWQTKRNSLQLQQANRILEEERKALIRNMDTASKSGADSRPGGAIQQAGRAGSILQKDAKRAANEAIGHLSELQAKVAYQGLLVQLYLQKRYHHLLIGTRFYRAIFDDGDSRLNLADSASNPFSGKTGSPPSVSVLESLASESISDVQAAIAAFRLHVERRELRGATEKLREALLVGEFLPELRTIPLELKRRVLGFFQKSLQLQAALDARNYSLAEQLIESGEGLQNLASDFDASKAQGQIQAAQQAVNLAIQKARSAMQSGDREGFEKALTEAAEAWPNHSELASLSTDGFRRAEDRAVTLKEFDDLIARKNYQRIGEQSGRFLAVMQSAPADKQAQLREALERVKSVENALGMAARMNEQGNPAGAWETVYLNGKTLPEEPRLSVAAADYASRAAAFVGAIQTAQKFRDESLLAPSLAWYLKARKIYPDSTLVRESLESLSRSLLEQLR